MKAFVQVSSPNVASPSVINANQNKRKQIIMENHNQSKPTSMHPTINPKQQLCKPIINLDQHQCKPTSMQPAKNANNINAT